MIEKEEEAKKREALERRAANAPAPGAKPKRQARNAPAVGNGSPATAGAADGDSEASEPSGAGTSKGDQARNSNPAGRSPRPGVKPKKRRR